MRSHLVVLVLMLPFAAGATISVEDGTANREEQALYKEVVGRFNARMEEFQHETELIVDRSEAEEREQLNRSYTSLIDQMSGEEARMRGSAIAQFEAFLAKYPSSVHTPHVMFRLADLHYEVTEESYFVADQEYNTAMEQLGPAQLDLAPEPPTRDYSKSIRLYEDIVRYYPDYEYYDGALYMLGYCYSKDGSVQYDEEEALSYYQRIVKEFPDSQFASQANMRIGEYYFDYNDIDKAAIYYQRIVEQGPDANLYDRGLYKLAWSYYKKSDYQRTMLLLNDLLDWSQNQLLQTGKESATEPEAIEYTAISISDMADTQQRSPVEIAKGFYAQVGPREFEDKVYKRLGDVLTQQARYEDAIEIYKYLQVRWPDDPENPNYQYKVAQLYMSLPVPDADAARDAISQITRTYSEESEWWQANRNNPDAQSVAKGFIEQSLVDVATTLHEEAIEEENPAKFMKAAAMYRDYLNKFPFADDYYEIEWYLADCLTKSGQLGEAEKEYQQLLKARGHDYVDGALWNLMQVRKGRLTEAYGNVFTRPPDAEVVEQIDYADAGKSRLVYKIDQQHVDYMDVCKQLTEHEFTVPDYVEAMKEYGPAFAYHRGQINYEYGHFDEAREAFAEVIDRWPSRDEAAFSAKLMVDSFTDEGDLRNVKLYSQIYASKQLGSNSVADAEHFTNLLEGSSFKICMEMIKQEDRESAAKCFGEFQRDFPKSENINKALYNEANSYEIIGNPEKANELFEKFINKYPDDEKSKQLFFRIANNYASQLELDKAVEYFENLAKRFPNYQDTPAARYNAAFLRIGLGDHAGAAKGLQAYALSDPRPGDAEQVYFQAGEQWEMVGDKEAAAFYSGYLREFPDQNPDHIMEAYYQLARIAERTGKERDVERAWQALSDAYLNKWGPTGRVGAAGKHYAAYAEFRNVEKAFEAFRVIKFTNNDDKNAELLIETKKNELEALVLRCVSLVQTYQDFEYSSASLYLQGAAYFAYADMLYDAPPPKSFTDEMLDIYYEQIDSLRIPIEDKGKNRLIANLEKARDAKRWSDWNTQAADLLNKRDPGNYPKSKDEYTGFQDSAIVPMAGAMGIRVPKGEAEAEEGKSPTGGQGSGKSGKGDKSDTTDKSGKGSGK